MKNSSRRQIGFATLALLMACTVPLAGAQGSAPENATATEAATNTLSASEQAEKQSTIRAMRDETIARLIKTRPEVKKELASAVGYAVFDASQTNLVLLVTSRGGGIVVDNASQKETFMKMTKLGTGPGLGHKKFKQVLVFKSRGLMEQFVSVGADVSVSADAVAKLRQEKKGLVLDGAASFNPNLSVYQMTDRGLLLQANWGGVGYLPDEALNSRPPKRGDDGA
jgi:lipid-binding SYLF domain-containing protein